jgi:hypothetical protein
MLSAIGRLGATSPTPATSPAPAATSSETSAVPATEPSADVRNAVYQFADALFHALDAGSGRQSEVEHEDRKHHGHERSQQVSHGRNGLAHRLAALARQLRDDAVPVTPPQTPDAPPAVTDPAPADGPVDATPAPTAPTTPEATTPAPATTTPTTPAPTTPTVPTTSVTPASTPLADAFAGLVDAMHAPAQSTSSGTDLVSRLASFLHQLAGALQTAPTAAAPAPVGLLIDTTA